MTASSTGRGAAALARVREIRERDSLVGLHRSQEVLLGRRTAATDAEHRLAALPAVRTGEVDAFLAGRQALSLGAQSAHTRHTAVRDSEVVAEESRRRWQADRVRLRSIERLVERRAAARRAEIARAETRMLDEVAEQIHHRRHRHPGGTG